MEKGTSAWEWTRTKDGLASSRSMDLLLLWGLVFGLSMESFEFRADNKTMNKIPCQLANHVPNKKHRFVLGKKIFGDCFISSLLLFLQRTKLPGKWRNDLSYKLCKSQCVWFPSPSKQKKNGKRKWKMEEKKWGLKGKRKKKKLKWGKRGVNQAALSGISLYG